MSSLGRRQFLTRVFATSAVLGAAGCQRGTRRSPADIREVEVVAGNVSTRDGAGVALRRALGHSRLPQLDPFLLLDEIRSNRIEDWQAGFPTHPHRGFETVSYLLSGSFEHKDSVGNSGVIGPGACQWMTAGRGIVHSEMPKQRDGADLWGFQLWVNLPARDKMSQPRYQELDRSTIPELSVGDGQARLIAGRLDNTRGPIDGISVAPTMLDMTLPAGGRCRHAIAAEQTAFALVIEGAVDIGARATEVVAGQVAVLSRGREMSCRSDRGGRYLLFAGRAIGEPIARRGPFVMNSEEELRQAFEDYRSGRLAGG